MDADKTSPPGLDPRCAKVQAVRWQWSRLPALSPAALYAALAVRQKVFAVEQQCAYLDADGLDHHAWHLLGWDSTGEERLLAAYLRLIDPGCKHEEPSIGRVLTAKSHRGRGLGRALMREGIDRCATLHPELPIRISAQQQLQRFYASLGFVTVSDSFVEDGIAHVEMRLGGSSPGRLGEAPAPRRQSSPSALSPVGARSDSFAAPRHLETKR